MLVQVPSESHDAPAPPSQAAVAVMVRSDAPPTRKRSADELKPPASTSGAGAVQVMEENKQEEQDVPSNRSGGVPPGGCRWTHTDSDDAESDAAGTRPEKKMKINESDRYDGLRRLYGCTTVYDDDDDYYVGPPF